MHRSKSTTSASRASPQHPDHELFASFPGAGKVMAPRLAVAFGEDRSRWQEAREIQSYSGIAPVVESSGRGVWVHARWRCPKFLKQTFHEFAQTSMNKLHVEKNNMMLLLLLL